LTLTDDLPTLVSAPGGVNTIGGAPATYNAGLHRITWTGSPTSGLAITVTFPVTVLAASPMAISNRAVITDAMTGAASDTAIVIANGWQTWLPIVVRGQ
jgi:hypothetical protein